jgi:hypothetical protein
LHLRVFRLPSSTPHTVLHKAATLADGTDVPSDIGPDHLASTTAAMVATAKDAVKTVKASPAMKKRSVDVIDEIRENKKVSKSMLASSPSELRHDFTFSFAITHTVSIAQLRLRPYAQPGIRCVC